MNVNVLILDQKNGDYRDLQSWPGMRDLVYLIGFAFLAISPIQPPHGVPFQGWVAKFTELIAKSYSILSAQRLLPIAADKAMAKCSEKEHPPLTSLIHEIAGLPVGPGQRLATYKESMVSALTDMDQAFGQVFNYTRSDCLQQIFTTPGIFAIEVGELAADHLGVLAHYITQYLYSWKAANPQTIGEWIHFLVYEDYSAQITRSKSQFAGGATLLEDRGVKQRYLNIGGIYLVHGVTELAPLLLQNANLIIGMAPRREDERVLRRVFGLSPEQVEVFKRLPHGMALASSPVWPHTLPVTIPAPMTTDGEV